MNFCFAQWVRIVKECAVTKAPSNEDLVRDLFSTIRRKTGIKDKRGQDEWVAKETVSALINRKENLPKNLRSAVLNIEFDQLSAAMEPFYRNVFRGGETDRAANELLASFLSSNNREPTLVKKWKSLLEDSPKVLTALLVESVRLENKVFGVKKILYSKGNGVLNYMYSDIITMSLSGKACKKRMIVVIPVDTGFHFHVTKSGEKPSCVSANTLHGKWVSRLEALGIKESEIVERIGRPKGKIGDVATFEYKNVLFYLLACSEFDGKNVAHATKTDISAALKSLLQFHDENGQGDEMFVPLIGTGLSRAKLSKYESFNLIRETIIANERWHNGMITIVVHANALNELEGFENALQN